VDGPGPDPTPEASSCWLHGCLIAAVVLSATLVLVMIGMLLTRISQQV
jgi:hypothetical protein